MNPLKIKFENILAAAHLHLGFLERKCLIESEILGRGIQISWNCEPKIFDEDFEFLAKNCSRGLWEGFVLGSSSQTIDFFIGHPECRHATPMSGALSGE